MDVPKPSETLEAPVWLSDEELANAIQLRREQARLVRSAPHATMQFNECHVNAEQYVAENPGCHVVGGWLLEDFADFSYFNAHAVVRMEDGSLFDPTPLLSVCLFLPHWGTEDEFAALRHNRPRVQHPFPDYELSHDAPVDEPDERLL
jgi:hypothetical protein